MARLRVLKDGVEIQNVDLAAAGKASVSLGRAESADIRLDDRAIGREHAVFLISSGGVAVQKKSKFGKLAVNGAEISESPIKPGDVINIADYLVKVEDGPAGPTPTAASTEVTPPQGTLAPGADGAAPDLASMSDAKTPGQGIPAPVAALADGAVGVEAPAEGGMLEPPAGEPAPEGGLAMEGGAVAEQPTGGVDSGAFIEGGEKTAMISTSHVDMRLTFKEGEANVTDYVIKKSEISIGRGSTCDVIIADKKSSRKHLIIKRVGMNFVAQDLGSGNGTFINGNKFSEQELAGNDVLRIGETEFVFKASSQEYFQQEQAQEFIAPPPEAEEPPPGDNGAMQALDPATGLPMVAPGEPNAGLGGIDPGFGGGIPGVGGVGGTGATAAEPEPKDLIGKLKFKWRKLPPKKQKLYAGIGVALAIMSLLGDDEDPKKKKKPNPKATVQAMNASGAGEMTPESAFNALAPEKKQFVVNEYQLASDLYKKQDFEKALYELSKIHGELAQGYKDSKAYESYAKKAIEIEKQNREEQERKVKEAEMRKQLQEMVTQAQQAFDAGKDPEAKDLFAKVLERDPENPTVLRLRQQMDDREQQKRAKEEAEKEKDFQRKQHELAVQIGRDLLKDGKYYELMDKMDDAMALLGSDPDLLAEARGLIQKAKDLLKSKTQPHLDAGKAAFDAGDFQKSREEFYKALAVDEKSRAAREGISKIREVVHERSRKIYIEAEIAEGVSDFKSAREKYRECLESAVREDSYFGRCERKFKRFELVGHLSGAATTAAAGGGADPSEPRAPAAAAPAAAEETPPEAPPEGGAGAGGGPTRPGAGPPPAAAPNAPPAPPAPDPGAGGGGW